MFTSNNPAAGRGHHSQVGTTTVDHPVPVQNYDFPNPRVPQERFPNNNANAIVAHSDALAENMKGFECSDLDNALLSGQAPPNGDFSFPFNAQGQQVRAVQHARMPVDINNGAQTFSPLSHGRASMDSYPYDEQQSVQGRPRSSQPSVSDSAMGEDFHQSTESVFSPSLQQNIHQGECHVDSYGRSRRVSDPCPQVNPTLPNHGATYQRTNSFPSDMNMRTHYNSFPANRGIMQNGPNMGNNVQNFYPNSSQTGHSNTQNVDTSLPGIYERSTDSQPPSISPHMHGQNMAYTQGRNPGSSMTTSVSKPMEYMPQGTMGHTVSGNSHYQGMVSMASNNTSNSRLHHLPTHGYPPPPPPPPPPQQYGTHPPQPTPQPSPTPGMSQLRQYPPQIQQGRLNQPHFNMGNGNPPYSTVTNFSNQQNFQSVDCAKPMFQGSQGNLHGNVNTANIAPSMPGLPRYPGTHTAGQPRYPGPQQGYMPNSGLPNKVGQIETIRSGLEFQNANVGASQRLRHFGPMLENGANHPKYQARHMQGYARHPSNAVPQNYTGMPPHMGDNMGIPENSPPASRILHPPVVTPATQTSRYRYSHPSETFPVTDTTNAIPSGPMCTPNFSESTNTRRYVNPNEGNTSASQVALSQEASFAKALQAMAKRDHQVDAAVSNQTWHEGGQLQAVHPPSIPDNQPRMEEPQEQPDLNSELPFTDNPEILEKRGDLVFSAELEKLAKLSRNPAFMMSYPGMREAITPPQVSQAHQQGQPQHTDVVTMTTDQSFPTSNDLIGNGQSMNSPGTCLDMAENQLPSFEQLVAERSTQQVTKSEEIDQIVSTVAVSSPPSVVTTSCNQLQSVPPMSVQTKMSDSPPQSVGNGSVADISEVIEKSESVDIKTNVIEKCSTPPQELSKQIEQEFATTEAPSSESPNAVKQLQRMTQSLKEKQEEVSKSRHVQYLSHNSETTTSSNQNCIAALSEACRNMIADLDSPIQKSVNHQLYSVVSDNGLHSPNFETIPGQLPPITSAMTQSPFLPQNPTFQSHPQPLDNLSSMGCSPVTDCGQQTPNSVSPGTFHLQYQNFLLEPVDVPPPPPVVEQKPKRKPRAKKRNASQDREDAPKKQKRKRKKESTDFSSLEGEINSVESSIMGSIDEQTNKMLEEASLISETELNEQQKMASIETSVSQLENVKSCNIENSDNVLSTPPDIQSSSPLDAVTLATISAESPLLITSPPSLGSPQSQPIPSAIKCNEVTEREMTMQQQQPHTPNMEQTSNNNNTIPNIKQNTADCSAFSSSLETANNISSCPGSVNSASDREEKMTFDGMQSRPNSSNSMDGSQSVTTFDLNCHSVNVTIPSNASIQSAPPLYPNSSIAMSTGAAAGVYVTTSTVSLPSGTTIQAPVNPGYPMVNNNQPTEAHPLEILQAQIQLQRQQFNISESRPLPYKNAPKAASSSKSKASKSGKAQNPVDVEKLMAEEDSTWYMPNETPKEPTVPWEQSKKSAEKVVIQGRG
ncbi:uncharacterized protein LOC144449182 isoform X2 [Glandiceps talaboti]